MKANRCRDDDIFAPSHFSTATEKKMCTPPTMVEKPTPSKTPLSIKAKISMLPKIPTETVDSLRKFDRDEPRRAEMFFETMSANFRWPVSIPDGQKKWILAALGDEDADNYYRLMARNLIFFYKQKDAHAFDHKFDKYVLVDKEQVIRFDDEGSAPICMPVDESRMMKTKPARTSERPSGGPSGSRDEAGVRKIFVMRSKTADEWLRVNRTTWNSDTSTLTTKRPIRK
ncbi:hypothetical protein BC936DRAFT_136546 [Jimgerdemannia flammicorona]|uniref:Uncharacterized protein n=1 Tax=Jimgerdemannia flammicorona TaxID=994334 RepID=A0A433DJG9_9FUNG|nr:hypothetical protein BC936DRAFT_136546 [Jimgerdemannia flammicorona]